MSIRWQIQRRNPLFQERRRREHERLQSELIWKRFDQAEERAREGRRQQRGRGGRSR